MRNQSPGEQIWANSRLFIAVRTSPDGGVGGVWRRSLGWLWRGGKELSCEGGRTGRCVFVRYHGGSGASAPVGVRRQRRANAVCGRPHFAVCSPHADQIGRAHVELQSRQYLVCRRLLEKKKKNMHAARTGIKTDFQSNVVTATANLV